MLLEEPNRPGEPKPFHMARDVFRSCMDKERIEQMGLGPLKEILRRLGGWPVLEGDQWLGEDGYIWYEQVSARGTEGWAPSSVANWHLLEPKNGSLAYFKSVHSSLALFFASKVWLY